MFLMTHMSGNHSSVLCFSIGQCNRGSTYDATIVSFDFEKQQFQILEQSMKFISDRKRNDEIEITFGKRQIAEEPM